MGWKFIPVAKEILAYHEGNLQTPVPAGLWQLLAHRGRNPRGRTHTVQEKAQIYPMHHPRANFLFASPMVELMHRWLEGLGKPMSYFASLQPAPVHSYILLYLLCL